MPLLAIVDVPASSANLGSGFDCLAAALSLRLRAELHLSDEPGILVINHGEGRDDYTGEGLVAAAFREGLRAAHGSRLGSGAWRIEVSSMIPAARGLGSSAAAIVAALLLGISAGRRAPGEEQLLALAARIEGHADNVAAAIYGGFTLAVPMPDGTLQLRRFAVPKGWIPVVFVPQATSATAAMRAALPDALPHRAAVEAAHRAALLAAAIGLGDASLLRGAMEDRLHQPYRLPLLPGSGQLIETAYEHGACGAALSGAGPSVLAICDSPATAHGVEKAFNASGLEGMAARLRFDPAGARVSMPGDRRGRDGRAATGGPR